jgi:hypothetical protein
MKIHLAGTTVAEPCPRLIELFKNGHKLHSYLHIVGGFETRWFGVNVENKVDLMLDSGAHTLYTQFMIKTGHANGYGWSDTPEFWKYVDDYAEFVKQNKDVLSVYVNVDVIFNPEQSWKVLKHLEKEHGLSPMPVIHHGTDLKWLRRHLDEGYDYIGLGGLGQEVTKAQYFDWADRAFNMICDQPSRMPLVKTHGFAMTSLDLMLRYPWYSVDSTTWVVIGRMGGLYVPRSRNGKWVYDATPWKVSVSTRSPDRKEAGVHIDTLPPLVRSAVLDYIHAKGYKLGKSSFQTVSQSYKLKENERWAEKKPTDKTAKRAIEIIEEEGLCNRYQLRDEINIIFFQDLEKSLPEWPWPFKERKRQFLL